MTFLSACLNKCIENRRGQREVHQLCLCHIVQLDGKKSRLVPGIQFLLKSSGLEDEVTIGIGVSRSTQLKRFLCLEGFEAS